MPGVPRVRLAPDGPEVSRIVLGLWRLAEWGDTDASLATKIERAIEMGITTFDHADIYGRHRCEEIFGSALRVRPELRERLDPRAPVATRSNHRDR